MPVIDIVIRRVIKPSYQLFTVYFACRCFAIYLYISLGFPLSLLDFILRQVILYILFTFVSSSGNIASDYVELLLLLLEIVRRVRVHKHGSIDK